MSNALALSPSMHVEAMLVYLRDRGWTVIKNGQWCDGYECVEPGNTGGHGLRQALQLQVAWDIGDAFRRHDRQQAGLED